MGQTESATNCSIELAPKSLSYRSFTPGYHRPQLDSFEKKSDPYGPWRVIINPSTELGGIFPMKIQQNPLSSCELSTVGANRRSQSLSGAIVPNAKGFSGSLYQQRIETIANDLYNHSKRILSSSEAKALVVLLEQRDPKFHCKTLATIGKYAMIPSNQVRTANSKDPIPVPIICMQLTNSLVHNIPHCSRIFQSNSSIFLGTAL